MYFVAFGEKQLSEISSVLARNSCYQRFLQPDSSIVAVLNMFAVSLLQMLVRDVGRG
jgi:hypothetical protein